MEINMEQTKIWKVKNNELVPIKRQFLPKEEMIQKWVESDISIISDDLIFIGSKVITDHNKEIDILAIDSEGDLVIIELKRDKTPREVVSQALDYAAYCATLTEDDINKLLQKNGSSETIEDLLIAKGFSYEDIDINEDQKILIVGTSIDPITERIVRFLSSKAVQINVTTFNYHKLNDDEYLTRNVLLEELEIEQTDKIKKKREKSFYKKLFEQNKLYIGMKVYFGPGSELLNSVDDSRIIASIANNSTKCLKYMNDSQLYSFSSLRKKITKDMNIENVKANWGFGGKYDWYSLDDRKALVELE
jgi:mannose/fructose/N-acetylgalactosamine-specific phosphotransferase system component IIB